LAASIAVKDVIQPLVVEPERDGQGVSTGFFLTTAGEGRRGIVGASSSTI
jgi:ParB family chromosome partitioning protein